MLGQSKKNLADFIRLLMLNSKDPQATETRWKERLQYIAMNNQEWPTILKNINSLMKKIDKNTAVKNEGVSEIQITNNTVPV